MFPGSFIYIYIYRPRSTGPGIGIWSVVTFLFQADEASVQSSIRCEWPGIISNLESIGFPVTCESLRTVSSHSGSLVALMCDELPASKHISVQMN